MALPQMITAAGAGKTADNVTLTLQSGPDQDGYSYYVSQQGTAQPDQQGTAQPDQQGTAQPDQQGAAQPDQQGAAQPDVQSGSCGVYFNNYLNVWYLTNPSQGTNNNWTSGGGTASARPSYVDYQSAPGQSFSAFPLTGWTAANAPAPAPAWNGAASAPSTPRRRPPCVF